MLVAIALSAGVAIRTVRLGTIPPGLHQDEACNGYDAYSILTTARDQHGNFLPLAPEAFEDYRPPLFDYSLVPLVGAFGLKLAVVRLCAALWGSVDLIALTALALLLLGLPGAAATAVLGALSPWHFPYCRYGVAYITASTLVTTAVLCFFLWLRSRRSAWLLCTSVLFGLSFYSYPITKSFTPLFILWLALVYWRELKAARSRAALALSLIVLLAIPQTAFLWTHPEARTQFARQSIFNYISVHNRGDPFASRYGNVGVAWLSYFTPSYLFRRGDVGDHGLLIARPGTPELLPEQALLLALSLLAPLGARRRKVFLVLLGWTFLAAIPAALSVPPGLRGIDAHSSSLNGAPTAKILMDHWEPDPALTPHLLLEHPSSRRDLLAIAPWTLMSALGLVVLLELFPARGVLGAAAAGLILAGAVFHGAMNVRSYFCDYPRIAAPYFQYGLDQVMAAIDKSGDPQEPVIITRAIPEPYIYVLFFEKYLPAVFQRTLVIRQPGLFEPVFYFDRYYFFYPSKVYEAFPHAIFVFAGRETTPIAPKLSIRYPDGTVAYNLVFK